MMAEQRREEVYRLEIAARRVRLSPRRIRRYVRAGLVQPVRVERGLLLFSEAELLRLRRIRRLTDDLGLNMPGVEVALRLLDQLDTLRRELMARESAGVAQVNQGAALDGSAADVF
jgi:MerR family transcriptional regulator/heat shock protein HspR